MTAPAGKMAASLVFAQRFARSISAWRDDRQHTVHNGSPKPPARRQTRSFPAPTCGAMTHLPGQGVGLLMKRRQSGRG